MVLAQDLLPIREISRLTGVNSVTLRAWERRYGLLKPLRTHKGHRLYCHEDVELVKKIQRWLACGLAIGKVSELLDSGLQDDELSMQNGADSDVWQSYGQELQHILGSLNMTKLEGFLQHLFSVYPSEMIADNLFAPQLDSLQQELFGNNVKKSLLETRVCEYLLMLAQRQRQQADEKRVAIVQLTSSEDDLLHVLLHYSFIMQQMKSDRLRVVSPSEALFAAEQLKLDAFVVFQNSTNNFFDFEQALRLLSEKITLPIFVGGKLGQAITREFPAHVCILSDAKLQGIICAVKEALMVGNDTHKLEQVIP